LEYFTPSKFKKYSDSPRWSWVLKDERESAKMNRLFIVYENKTKKDKKKSISLADSLSSLRTQLHLGETEYFLNIEGEKYSKVDEPKIKIRILEGTIRIFDVPKAPNLGNVTLPLPGKNESFIGIKKSLTEKPKKNSG